MDGKEEKKNGREIEGEKEVGRDRRGENEKAENVGHELGSERRREPGRRQGRESVLGRASLSGKLLIP